ncbi:MAG: preprotein translocase subunit YajC [Candidatus Kapabacteria bacterium]|nr:preprotein translocase subunit YajC [Candidatus Kapabacteria bacterium]
MIPFANTFMIMTPPAGGNGGAGSMLPTLLFFGVIILVMYFMMIRPQKKRQQEHQKMLDGLRKGDKVITGSGIHGEVADTDEKTIDIKIAENVKIKVDKAAIVTKK